MTNVILCGGSGTRLWPLSRKLLPKQFIKIFSANSLSNSNSHLNLSENSFANSNLSENSADKSLFQLCVERNRPLCQNCLIVSNEEQYFLALDQLEELDGGGGFDFLLEPLAKNTAAAICLAALSLPKDEICLVTPSDHLIKNQAQYAKVLTQAFEFAENNFIVTLGIKPDTAQTGFGYIKMGENNAVLGFYEKPDLKTAQAYIKSGDFFFNSGIFIFKAEFFLKQSKIPQISIDYALMEKSDKMKVIPASMAWSDVGSFDALYDEFVRDEKGNVIKANALNLDSKGNFIYGSNPKKLIATADIENLIIIDTEDSLMICQREKSQKVKELVENLDEESKFRKIHTTAHRPWGSYTVLEDEKGYKLKRLVVKPHKRLSLQKHFHRNEHWIVVSGTATVVVGDEKKLVRPNESTYIKMGQIHRLSNEGKIPVVLIEAQVGEYTEEDDIVRIEDEFNRK